MRMHDCLPVDIRMRRSESERFLSPQAASNAGYTSCANYAQDGVVIMSPESCFNYMLHELYLGYLFVMNQLRVDGFKVSVTKP